MSRKRPEFTKPQSRELVELLYGPRSPFGTRTARVQNALKAKSLVVFAPDPLTEGHAEHCELTPGGRVVAERLRAERDSKIRGLELRRKKGARGR